MTNVCIECGAPLDCNPGPDCWCHQLPQAPVRDLAGCSCRSCLAAYAARVSGEAVPRSRSAKGRSCRPAHRAL